MPELGGPPTSSEIIFYQGEDGRSRIQVRLDGGTVWLTQRLLAELYQVSVPTINQHIGNIFEEGELDPGATIRKVLIVQTEGRALRDIESVCRRLQSVGVRHIVLTADHGFLLQDETTRVQPYGKATDPARRHVYAEQARADAGLLPISMAALGYEGVSGYLLFREDTAVFATKTVGASFVHGGNSLQERVIPALTLSRKRLEADDAGDEE